MRPATQAKSSAQSAAWSGRRLLGRRGVRIVVGVLWLIDAALQAEPAKFQRDYPLQDLAQSVMGAPSWVNRSVFAGIRPFVAHWPWWNLAAVILQAVIGVALISGRAVRPMLAVSFVWALAIWWVGEAFGALTTGMALLASGAPGSALLYALLGALAWPRRKQPDVDQSWWSAAWVSLWVGTVLIQVQSSYPSRQVLTANLHDLSDGQPAVLKDTASWMVRIVGHNAGGVTSLLIVVQVAVALGCVLDHRRLKVWLGLGISVSLFFWVVFQQVGGILTSSTTDLNAAPLIIVLALAAWPSGAPVGSTSSGRASIPTEATGGRPGG